VQASDYFSLPESLAVFRDFFPADLPPWEWLRRIGPALLAQKLQPLDRPIPPGLLVEGPVYIDPSVQLPHNGTLIGPLWIGPGTKLLPGCYLRGNVIVGANCTVGHNAEIKNSLLLDKVQVPHRPYIGDSVLGNAAHLGAGVVISNLRLDQKNIVLRVAGSAPVDTGLRKFGAILGDGAEVGCNAVLNPGTILGKRALVTPTVTASGIIPAATIVHARTHITLIPRRD
jgi:NDP-sugar pyrophosphorylase family protein